MSNEKLKAEYILMCCEDAPLMAEAYMNLYIETGIIEFAMVGDIIISELSAEEDEAISKAIND